MILFVWVLSAKIQTGMIKRIFFKTEEFYTIYYVVAAVKMAMLGRILRFLLKIVGYLMLMLLDLADTSQTFLYLLRRKMKVCNNLWILEKQIQDAHSKY